MMKTGIDEKWQSGAIGLGCSIAYLTFGPPLFDFDGYMYRLEGLTARSALNPTHLLWVPCQSLIWDISILLGHSSPRFFQTVGMMILGLVMMLSFRLWVRASGDAALAAAMAVFVMFSPQVWFLGTQNQPYPLIFLFIVSYLMIWQKPAPEPPYWSASFWLSMTVLFHEAGILLFAGGAYTLYAARRPSDDRLRGIFLWLFGSGLVIAAVYMGFGVWAGLHSFSKFYAWLSGYLHTQHKLQGRLYEKLSQGAIGLLKTGLQLESVQDRLYDHFDDLQIRRFVISLWLLGMAGAASAWMGSVRLRSWIRRWPWREPLFQASLGIILSWAVFAVLWEPVNYYWSVALFPVAAAMSIGLRHASPSKKRLIIIFLLGCTGWNVYATYQLDRIRGARFPDPQLLEIRARVQKKDLLLFLKPGWEKEVDYDLLAECLKREGYGVRMLLDDFVVRRPASWASMLDSEIRRTWKRGGNVFISGALLDQDLYGDLADTEFLSPYTTEKYLPISGDRLYMAVKDFMQRHSAQPSTLEVGSDRFLILVDRR